MSKTPAPQTHQPFVMKDKDLEIATGGTATAEALQFARFAGNASLEERQWLWDWWNRNPLKGSEQKKV